MQGDVRLGPVSTEYLQALILNRKVHPSNMVWTAGMPECEAAWKHFRLPSVLPDPVAGLIIGAVLGGLFGIVISYYFQPIGYRFTVSLGGYFSDLPIILTRPDQPYEESYIKAIRVQMRTTVVLVTLFFFGVGAVAGYWLQRVRRRWV